MLFCFVSVKTGSVWWGPVCPGRSLSSSAPCGGLAHSFLRGAKRWPLRHLVPRRLQNRAPLSLQPGWLLSPPPPITAITEHFLGL